MRHRMGIFQLVVRLLQTSLMTVVKKPIIQSSFVSVITLVAICVQRELSPYRRASDNLVGLMTRW